MWAQPQTENSQGARAAHSCNLIKDKLYLFGGWNGKNALNDLWTFDFTSSSWNVSLTDGKLPAARNNHASIVVEKLLMIHGGHDGSQWLDDFYTLDTVTLTWSKVKASGEAPSARACHTISRIGKKLYLFGGYDGTNCFNSIDIFDLETSTWMQPIINSYQPAPRNAHTMSVTGKKLIMFGGHSGNKHLRDLYIFDTDTMEWSHITRVRGSYPPGLRGHSANVLGNKIFFFGGYDGRGRSSEVYILDLSLMAWERPSMNEHCRQLSPAGRQRHTACLVGSKVYIIGGFDGSKWLHDMHILDIGKMEEFALTASARRHLINHLSTLLNDPDMYPDIKFIVEGKPIHAHKAILASQCDHFKAMFSSGMKESRQNEIVIPGWSYNTFYQMLEFIYSGYVQNLTVDDALELIGLADHYTLSGLTSLCESTLIHKMVPENACIILSAAHHYQVASLKQQSVNYILKHFEQVGQTESFANLDAQPQLLMEVTRATMQRLSFCD